MRNYIIRTTQLTIVPEGEPIYSEMATKLTIEDESAVEFVVIKQSGGSLSRDEHAISITPDEWPTIRNAMERMIAECQGSKP